jgi:hypothetical protein
MAMENPVTPSGIKSTTVRFVVQYLHHFTTVQPYGSYNLQLIVGCNFWLLDLIRPITKYFICLLPSNADE